MKALSAWLDQRTAYRQLLHEALYENIPGGARWRYIWGSTLVFTFTVQVITGLFLWLAYSPSAQTAWESVFYIQYQMQGGWLLRGLHHYTAQLMNVLMVLHLLQVVIDGAYKAPRELNFWTGLVMLLLVLSLSLTGYLLPWDQKGFWATRVATNIAAITPLIGPALQRLIIGGPDYGHLTLTRFFALHAGVVPGAILVLLVGHIFLFRRHGITARDPRRGPDEKFWPDQVLKDAVACLAVLATALFLIVYPRLFHPAAPLGADLGAPADLSEPYPAARPEWYFLFLFQLLKYFPGKTEILGAMVLPSVVLAALFAMPFLGRRKPGHYFNLAFLFALLLSVAWLTYGAIRQDRHDPDYQEAVREADANAERVVVLAKSPRGIPATGAVTLLREDPLTRGPKLFAKNCANCHRFDGHDGTGHPVKDPPAAADLKTFASRAWIAGLLDPDKIVEAHYFGGTKFKDGKMAKFLSKDVAGFSPPQKEELRKAVLALSAEAQLRSQRVADERDAAAIVEGRALLASSDMRCTECHQFRKPDPDTTGPDLTGYGSREWIIGMITSPKHPRFYGRRNDRMPAFGDDNILDAQTIGILADWLRGDWYEPDEAAR
ncbi:MAG: cytochrome b N-terminal domain-containing protein [Limisphaerales bacterium]